MAALLALMVGTFASEDLACMAAGLLIQQGQVSAVGGVGACLLGIFLGDCGLWAVGRVFGAAVLRWPRFAGHVQRASVDQLRLSLRGNLGSAILASRFLPGTRLVLYLLAGVLNVSSRSFAAWAFAAALLWTPLLVLGSAGFGHAAAVKLGAVVGAGPTAIAVSAALLTLAVTRWRWLLAPARRHRMAARIARWSRWEFWPMWLFYPPVAGWVTLLALRYRGLSTMTAANPGMADGGTVGESKYEILSRLPGEWTVPALLLAAGEATERMEQAQRLVAAAGWRYPLILKPDVGERGAGVKLVRSAEAVRDYLRQENRAVIVQPYHPGPYEAGIFYYRMPHWPLGRILSITDKHFPFVIGDGVSTLEELVRAHPRYRMQADTFLRRHDTMVGVVLPDGARFQLAIAGNHAQGTLFRDGAHLLTPALERRVDDIARSYPGFFVGRFDVRYRDVDRFTAGDDLAIVELNGATAESTNIYDPDGSLLNAYRTLFRQWSIVFAIGAANRAQGAPVTPLRRLMELGRARAGTPAAMAD
jgi:membrane protein DedA with SNARE-associated domain